MDDSTTPVSDTIVADNDEEQLDSNNDNVLNENDQQQQQQNNVELIDLSNDGKLLVS